MIRRGFMVAALLLTLGVSSAALLPASAGAQVDAFRYELTRVPVGTLYEYVKSNLDGTHEGPISLYVLERDRIESLKWSPDDTTATLVAAELDWESFSVRRFESWALARGVEPELRATLEADSAGTGVRLSFQPDVLLPVTGWPWHSYDFDFASLGLAMPHLVDPESPFRFQRADITYDEAGPPFADLGPVDVRFVGYEERAGIRTRLYELDGSGLRNQRGKLWSAVEGGHLVEFELPFPDEPGFTDVRVRLVSVSTLSAEGWEDYKRERIRGGR
jgi:hypothetical protein